MLNTHIYIYSDYHKSWLLFGKNGNYNDGVKGNENYLYMCHVNRNHYSVVADVNTHLIKYIFKYNVNENCLLYYDIHK